jgi:hypothetical protein
MRRLASLCVVVLVAAGCTSEEPATTSAPTTITTAPTTTTATPTSTAPKTTNGGIDLPSGWTTFEGSTYTIGLPEFWVDGRSFLDDPDFQEAIADELADFDLGGFEGLAQSLVANEGVDFLFNLGAFTGSFAENLNVLQFPAGAADDLAVARELGPVQLESAGATDVTSVVIELDRFLAVFISYRLPDVGVGMGHQYWIATEETVYVLTFAGAEEADFSVWRRMVNTFAPRS